MDYCLRVCCQSQISAFEIATATFGGLAMTFLIDSSTALGMTAIRWIAARVDDTLNKGAGGGI